MRAKDGIDIGYSFGLNGVSELMSLPKHKRNQEGAFPRGRSDSLAGNLRKDYPEFEGFRVSSVQGSSYTPPAHCLFWRNVEFGCFWHKLLVVTVQ
jgi:hypothetical protein